MDSSESLTDAPESRPTPSRSFREATIAFAVDTSGSTEGPALTAEKEAIKSIASLLPRDRQSSVTVLPWNDRCEIPVRINGLQFLRSDGGTDPAVLFHAPKNRMVLSESHFWFLMTDGMIEPQEVRNFTARVTSHGMHGKACVVTIFGVRDSSPGQCNISVGLSVFATSPHVAFLYKDILSPSRKVYILGVKGCFVELLRPGENSPKLDRTTRWEDLPQTSFENLTRVSVPPPQEVGKDEIILEGGRVNLDQLFSQTEVQESFLEKIFDNKHNQHSISLAAKAMGREGDLDAWLDRVDDKIDAMETTNISEETNGPGDSEPSVDQIIADLMSNNMDGGTVVQAQRRLSKANEAWEHSRRSSDARNASLNHRRRSSTGTMRRMSVSGLDTAINNLTYVSVQNPFLPPPAPGSRKLFNPGFSFPGKDGDYVRGICMLCAKPDTLMCLHLVKPPTSLKTQGLPPPGAQARFRYPLAMGNFPETDIISSFITCDPCSVRLLKKTRRTPHGETIVANLPLVVCDGANKDAWIETISLATERRFSADDIIPVFLAILATKVERFPNEQNRKSVLRFILDWCCRMLLREADAHVFDSDEDEDRWPDADHGTRRLGAAECRIPLLDGLRHDFEIATKPTRKPSKLLTYPLDGFIVANVIVSNSMLKTAISHERRGTIVWMRFLYRLTETYHALRERETDALINTATSLLLLQQQSASASSSAAANLFRLENLRHVTIHKPRGKPSDGDSSETSTAEFFRSIGALLATRAQRFRLAFRPTSTSSTSHDGLAGTPFFHRDDLADFERLGPLFSWIADGAGHALALFLNWLLRCDGGEADGKGAYGNGNGGDGDKYRRFANAEERFVWLRRNPNLRLVFEDPRAVSPRFMEEHIKDLAPLRH